MQDCHVRRVVVGDREMESVVFELETGISLWNEEGGIKLSSMLRKHSFSCYVEELKRESYDITRK